MKKMVNNKKITLIIGGLVLTLSGGIFAFIYTNGLPSMSSWSIFAIAGFLVLVISIGIAIVKKTRLKQTQTIQSSTQLDSHIFSDSKHQNCFWCGNLLRKHGEFCSDCGKKILRCIVCKLPISFGDEIGKCSLCESKGHFAHLFEWVKTKGTCPHCLQRIPTQAIIETSEIK